MATGTIAGILQGVRHLSADELAAGLDQVRAAPPDDGRLVKIVRRPAIDEREVLEEGWLDPAVGLVGDNWAVKPSTSTPDGSPHPEKQITVMNARFAALIAGDESRWELAGDQLYVDMDISTTNLPPGSRLLIGDAELEVTEPPHTGCAKFASRFGPDALRLANSPEGRELRLRGMNTKVVNGGPVRAGETIRKAAPRPH